MTNFLLLVLLAIDHVASFTELPLIRRQHLERKAEANDLDASAHASGNAFVVKKLCRVTADLRNCSMQDNLSTVIGLGTPPQIFRVQLQFFSDYLWVFDWSCKLTNCGSELPKNLFDRSLSRTFIDTGSQRTIQHQNYRLNSTQVMDIATLGSSTWPVNFGLVERAPCTMDTDYDGVLGLRPSRSKQNLLTALLENKPRKIVSVFLRNSVKMRGQDDGRLTIGKLNIKHCESSWQYAKLTSERSWKVIATRILLGSTMILGTSHEVILNPGNLITFTPKWVAADLHERLGARKHLNSNLFVIHSADLRKLPSIHFIFNGVKVQFSAEHYTAKLPTLGDDLRVVTVYGLYETPTWQLGEDFFRSYCVALDLEIGRIGFAKHMTVSSTKAENLTACAGACDSTTAILVRLTLFVVLELLIRTI